jgi:hypothetical protein
MGEDECRGGDPMSSFSKWDRDAYRARVGEDEAARRRGAIMAEQWGYQLAEQRKRLGFTQAGLAELMGVTPGRVSQIEHIGGHLLKMPVNPAA